MLRFKQTRNLINNVVLYGMCLLLAAMYPFKAFAEDAALTVPAEQTTTSATSDQTSVPPPTSTTVDTSTTTPVENTSAPSSTTTTSQQPAPPAPKKNYYYDPTTNRWNTDVWKYDATSGVYKAVPAPQPAVVQPTPPSDTTSDKTDTSSVIDAKTTNQIANALDSLAKTGNAGVIGNTTAGSATSGDASVSATIVNNVNSSLSNSNNTEAASFVSNVMGDVNGDIILQPMLLKAMLEAGTKSAVQDQTINSTNSTNINNDVNLAAQSGDATVAKNTNAGNATSGDANTVADVVNIVNSMISANQSFMGTINIYGNLNGDILIAPDFLSQLMASNGAGGSAPAQLSQVVNSTDTQSIVNNVALAANSGKAVVTGNTSAGNATSGSANTNVVLFNLSGHQIVASNSLLVFVNVLGKWVGVIVDAPTGTTAAAIGSGVQQNTFTEQPSMAINAINNTQITNNINLSSQTGDATVAGNTFAGNATSGNATASANIANISNSQLGLSGWFGILFINVFGTWVGSFGVDTSAGNPIITNGAIIKTRASVNGKLPLQVLTYVPHVGSVQPTVNTTLVTPTGVQTQAANAASVRAAQIFNAPSDSQNVTPINHAVNLPLTIGSLLLTLVSLYALRRFLF